MRFRSGVPCIYVAVAVGWACAHAILLDPVSARQACPSPFHRCRNREAGRWSPDFIPTYFFLWRCSLVQKSAQILMYSSICFHTPVVM